MKKLQDIKGIGPAVEQKLNSAGVSSVPGLLWTFPRSYIDYSDPVKIANLEPGMVAFRARIVSSSANYARRGLHITRAKAADDTGEVNLVWFNQPYRQAQLESSGEVYIAGEYKIVGRYLQVQNASLTVYEDLAKSGLQPIYRQKAGIKPGAWTRMIAPALAEADSLDDYFPHALLSRFGLAGLPEAIRGLHAPSSSEDLHVARRTIAQIELFRMSIAAQLNMLEQKKVKSPGINLDEQLLRDIVAKLPFALTGDQKRSTWQAAQSLSSSEEPTNMLINGDVGSGKTIVAFLCSALAIASSHQVAVIAPTEILAAQHFETFRRLSSVCGQDFKVGMLSANSDDKSLTQQRIESGDIDLVVGTHSLLEPTAKFHSLGLVIVDEQHRFGVNQRNKLKKKSSLSPHMISMTATPIPRSLLLTLYGELEPSIIKEKPKGRIKTTTHAIGPAGRPKAHKALLDAVKKGHQAAIIAPQIKASDTPVMSIEKLETMVARTAGLKSLRSASLHGDLRPVEKDEIMRRFADGEIDLLLATTVIEVGVDVPNLNFMVIESAERFGLAQLHQLRGRVGRGSSESEVFAVSTTDDSLGKRLRLFAGTDDGFRLAKEDLDLRGPGEIYGTAQSGGLGLSQADLTDIDSISQARDMAAAFLAEYHLEDYPDLARDVLQYQKISSLN